MDRNWTYGMGGDMDAIPTTYRNVRFRSRLEAKWAAFFDRVSWPWEYEPVDLAGYIPDFILKFPKPIIAEVKPVLVPEEFEQHEEKIDASGWTGEVLIVGAFPFTSTKWDSDWLSPGWLGERQPEYDGLLWDEAVFCGCCGIGFFHSIQTYQCRACGYGDGDAVAPVSAETILSAWADAANAVQWKPGR